MCIFGCRKLGRIIRNWYPNVDDSVLTKLILELAIIVICAACLDLIKFPAASI